MFVNLIQILEKILNQLANILKSKKEFKKQLNENLKDHVMSQLDPTSDHYPFLAQGIDASHLWRWRFDKRHASSEFHHESADTSDKVNIPELKNYIANLSRILFRLSITETESWPSNNISIEKLRERIKKENDSVIRVF